MLAAAQVFVGLMGLRDLKTRFTLVALGEEGIVVEHLCAQIGTLGQGFLDRDCLHGCVSPCDLDLGGYAPRTTHTCFIYHPSYWVEIRGIAA